MHDAIAELVFDLCFRIFLLPFRIFWWAFQKDFGLLEAPLPNIKKASKSSVPPSSMTVWDREIDGPGFGV